MRALLLWRAKALGAALPFPAAARLWSSAVDSNDSKKKKRNNIPILGIDLPEVWDPLDSARSPAPPQKAVDVEFPAPDELVATVIDGKSMAAEMRLGIAEEVRRMKDAIGKVPGLAVVLVGQRRDSQSYVRFKMMACEEVGIKSLLTELPEGCAEDDVVNAVSSFNNDPSVHGPHR